MNPQPKPRRERDPKYLEWIRKQPCLSCRSLGVPIEAHHVLMHGGGKVGSKTDDRRAVPLCHGGHRDYHNFGRRNFERTYHVDLEAEIIRLNAEYNAFYPSKPKRERPIKPRVLVKAERCKACGHRLTKKAQRNGIH